MYVKRLGIFFFFDFEGIVDDYVTCFLNGLKPFLSNLVIVCNGILTSEGREKFSKFTHNIIVRENKGMDVIAYKTGIEFFGWNKLEQYDEIIFFNHTLFGPLYPFKEMFDTMDARKDVDFWGITKHHKVDFDPFHTCKYGYMPEHIQSSFLVIRKHMVASYDYQNFWNNMPPIDTYGDSVGKYEVIFTKDFEEKGFKSDVYINTEDLRENTWYPLMMMPRELVENRRCPVIKRKSFSQNYSDMLMETAGEATLELYDFIDKHLDYDVNLIWDNILRTMNMAEIKQEMQLNYTIPRDYLIPQKNNTRPRIALVMHLYFMDLLDKSYQQVCNMPADADIYITTGSVENKKIIEEKFRDIVCHSLIVILVNNRGRDVSGYMMGVRDYVMKYDLVLFLHDKKTAQMWPRLAGESFGYQCFENVIGSKELVENIITIFMENPRMGILTPPPPVHASFYFYAFNGSWAGNGDLCKKWAKILKLTIPIEIDKDVIAPIGSMFWCRPLALKPLYDYPWTYDDFPQEPAATDGTIMHVLERLRSISAQHMGYYCAWGMNDHFNRIFTTNLFYMVQGLNAEAWRIHNTTEYLSTKVNLNEFITRYLPYEQGIAVPRNKLPFLTKMGRIMKRVLPGPMYHVALKIKRLIFGPHNIVNKTR